MARVVGVDLPREKRVDVGLTYIYGVGRQVARRVVSQAQVEPSIRVKDLSEAEVQRLQAALTSGYMVEGDLRREVAGNIKRLMDIASYRGVRHRRGLPVRGQRTHTNARTRKGPKRGRVKRR